MARVLLTLLIGLMMSSFSHAKMYKWVDEEGNVHYTQTKPPADTEVETIKPPPKVTPPPAPAKAEPEASAADADVTEDEATKQKNAEIEQQNAEIRKQNCAASRERLDALNNAGGRIKYTDDDGNVAWASDEQVAERKATLEANVKKWCK